MSQTSPTQTKNLTEVPLNFEGTIRELQGEELLTSRLQELGFIRGERIKLRGKAPFGEPLLVEVRGSTIALRKREAQCIQL